ncbi:MAG: hypothetical protein AABZ80_13110 [Gemmatimonadota bacterium]
MSSPLRLPSAEPRAPSLESLVSGLESAATSLDALRALLPAPLPQAPGMPTGMDALDDALASSGFPRGRLTEIVGATGKLTLLRRVVDAAVARGEWVAYIDASRTLAPRDWAHLSHVEGVWMVRPPEPARAAWCADVLLRSAAFSLVVLDSAPLVSRAIAVRLMGLARDSNAAFVVASADNATKLGGAVRLRVNRRRQRLRIAIEKGAASQNRVQGGHQNLNVVEISCVDGMASRLCAYPEVPDRRGAARGAGRRDTRRGRAAEPLVEHGILQAR